MKRSRSINIHSMRQFAWQRVPVKPLALAVAAATLFGCSSRDPALAYESVAQCLAENPDLDIECRAAFQKARDEAAKAGPKYQSKADCEAEFGAENCVAAQPASQPQQPQQQQSQSWFMPAMAGFMLGRALDGGGYRSAPLYSSTNRNSPFYGQWTGVDGKTYGSRGNRSLQVGKDAFKPKPAVTRTISRGGFGSTVAAKSNWGGNRGSRSGGWGG